MDLNFGIWNIRGMGTSEKQKEVLNLIRGEKLKICAILETRLKANKLQRICDRMFDRWEWVSNMQCCSKGCTIVLGWDGDDVQIQMNKTSQSSLCIIQAPDYNFKCYFTFVYAANSGSERKELWKSLVSDGRFVNGFPWGIAGD